MPERNRILVVDDDPGIREQLSFALRDAGHPVDLAATAAEARRMLAANDYAVVITDWWLSDSDGLVLANEAAALGATTFVMSGYALTLLGRAAELHRMLRKPISPAALVDAVDRVLSGRAEPQGGHFG
jgi:DNA-binding NtrC family response regulator